MKGVIFTLMPALIFLGSYHKRQISNPPTLLPPMLKSLRFQICQRPCQPNLTFDFGGYDY